MTEPQKAPSLIRKTPWQLIAILVLLAFGLAAGALAPGRYWLTIAAAFLVISGALLILLWRLAVSTHAHFERS